MLRLMYLILGLFFTTLTHSGNRYFICGGDEDGCLAGHYESCLCIPQNDQHSNRPYCLNFGDMTCTPIASSPGCDSDLIFKNQGSCLATLFQSQPELPCAITTRSFCIDNHAIMCPPDGRLSGCY